MTDKLKLKSSHEVVYTVDVADVDSIFQGKPTDPDILTVLMKDGKRLYCDEVCPIDSMQEEPVSEDLEEAAKKYGTQKHPMTKIGANESAHDFKAGAKWQKEEMLKDARDVIVKNLDSLSYWDCIVKLKCADKDIVKVICVKEE